VNPRRQSAPLRGPLAVSQHLYALRRDCCTIPPTALGAALLALHITPASDSNGTHRLLHSL